ncbi:MAG: hypothetical protein B6D55_04745 [Candidatus Omnitrophica bacterium 4484_70.2]|nr:MAG: hypothetical protein B6D55_04745 [Candidatus Omnitrophica bacterium 4484_70.2]
MRVKCKDCGYRLGNSNFCLKKLQVISTDRPKRCKDFVPKTKLKFSIEIKEEEKKVIATPQRIEEPEKPSLIKEVIIPTSETRTTGDLEVKFEQKDEILNKAKLSLWERVVRWIKRKKR